MKEKAVVGRRSSYNSRFNEHFVVNKEFLQEMNCVILLYNPIYHSWSILQRKYLSLYWIIHVYSMHILCHQSIS